MTTILLSLAQWYRKRIVQPLERCMNFLQRGATGVAPPNAEMEESYATHSSKDDPRADRRTVGYVLVHLVDVRASRSLDDRV